MLKEEQLILVIEDEVIVRENIVLMLQSEGYPVVDADSVTGGLEKAFEQNPSLILCDLMLGREQQGGFIVLERIRLDEKLKEVPFIFITARVERHDMRHAMEMGADDYLTKPFNRAELLGAVFAQLGKAKKFSTLIKRTYLLVIYEPNKVPYRFKLQGCCRIGRSNNCDLVFRHSAISRYHCTIQEDIEKRTGYHISDGDITAPVHTPSSGGTFIKRRNDNLLKVKVRIPLIVNDRIFLLHPDLEQSIRIDFLLEGEPESEGTLS
ncbi:MAG TPA: response regulator [Cyanophyceae cyanobacterium]